MATNNQLEGGIKYGAHICYHSMPRAALPAAPHVESPTSPGILLRDDAASDQAVRQGVRPVEFETAFGMVQGEASLFNISVGEIENFELRLSSNGIFQGCQLCPTIPTINTLKWLSEV